jgi:hypothetical protein
MPAGIYGDGRIIRLQLLNALCLRQLAEELKLRIFKEAYEIGTSEIISSKYFLSVSSN